MSLFIIINSLLCLLIAVRAPDNPGRLLVLDRPETRMEKFHPVSSWSMLLKDLESVSEIVIIERRASTCGASGNDIPCDLIEVSSGILNEYLTIDDPEMVILGLPGPEGDRVVLINPGRIATSITFINAKSRNEITEICLEHYSEQGFRICPEPDEGDSASIRTFSMDRKELANGEVQYICNFPMESLPCDQICIHQAHLLPQD